MTDINNQDTTTTIYLSRPSIKDCLLNENNSLTEETIKAVENLVLINKLKWIPSAAGTGVYFIGKDLASASNRNIGDFYRTYKKLEALNTYSFIVKPRVIKLTGGALKRFKKLNQHYSGSSLGSTNSLYLANWSAALIYMEVEIEQELEKLEVKLPELSLDILPPTSSLSSSLSSISYLTEKQIHDALSLLAMRTSFNIKSEVVISDSLRPGNSSRRFDLVKYDSNNENITIYEIKKKEVSDIDVTSTLGLKGYLNLMKAKYSSSNVNLVFVSGDITHSAKRLVELMPDVSFLTIKELANELLEDALRLVELECANQVDWMRSKIVEDFPLIF